MRKPKWVIEGSKEAKPKFVRISLCFKHSLHTPRPLLGHTKNSFFFHTLHHPLPRRHQINFLLFLSIRQRKVISGLTRTFFHYFAICKLAKQLLWLSNWLNFASSIRLWPARHCASASSPLSTLEMTFAFCEAFAVPRWAVSCRNLRH